MTHLDQLIREADPARHLEGRQSNAAAARSRPQHRSRAAQLSRTRPASAVGVALSIAVVVVIVVVFSVNHAPVRTSANDGRQAHRFSAQVLQSAFYCSKRGGGFDLPCKAHTTRGYVHVPVDSEVLIDARFRAPIAVDSKSHFYEAAFRLARSAGCDAGSFGTPSMSRVQAGQRVALQAFVPLSCPGPVRVSVRYIPDDPKTLSPGAIPAGTKVIGRATVTVR
jgi:hypothetical protein